MTFRLALHDNDVELFLPLLQAYCNRWKRIEIVGGKFALIKQVLAFTTFSDLHILECLVVRMEHIAMHSLLKHNALLTLAPRLTTLDVSSFLFLHLPPVDTLINVTLRPCYVTRRLLVRIARSPVETLKLGLCAWDSFVTSSPISYSSLLQLTVERIEWVTLRDLLDVLVAPRLDDLAIMLDLDQYTIAIDMEDTIALSHHLPSVTRLSITALSISAPMDFLRALIFLFGWKFPGITHLTTNFPMDYLMDLQTPPPDAIFPWDFEAMGFFLANITSIPCSLPAMLFPRLSHLRCSDTTMHLSHRSLSIIAHWRRQYGYPLVSIMCHFDQLSPLDIAELKSKVGELHDWTEDEVDFEDGTKWYGAL